MILDKILASKREEVQRRKALVPPADLAKRLHGAPAPRDFASAIRRGRDGAIRLIAEFKRASPSQGVIRADLAPAQVARLYSGAGAAAMSVLTDAPFFQGSADDLRSAREAVTIPVLQKDFILDDYQVLEARTAGADAILLIAAALPGDELARLHRRAAEFGLAALVEVHDESDLDRALAIRPKIVGINNRDLRTFGVDLAATFRLRPLIPPAIIVVSESGIRSRADALRLQEAGVDAMLVGERLMRQPDPGRAAAELLGA
ncbi:MAG: indole-3-glycerol phosphate synthase TrpC [Candidatus Brocadiia bacterium]